MQHGQLSKWWYCEEELIIYLSLSHVSEAVCLKEDIENGGKISVGRADEATENSICKANRNCLKKKNRCTCRVTLNHNTFLRLFPGYGPMGLSRKQGCGKNRVDRIKVTYRNWAGRTRCCWFLCTMNDGEV